MLNHRLCIFVMDVFIWPYSKLHISYTWGLHPPSHAPFPKPRAWSPPKQSRKDPRLTVTMAGGRLALTARRGLPPSNHSAGDPGQ